MTDEQKVETTSDEVKAEEAAKTEEAEKGVTEQSTEADAKADVPQTVDEKTADEAAVEAAVGEEASVLISEAAAG